MEIGAQLAGAAVLTDRDGDTGKVAAVIEYDGTGYCGFQRQARERTVQAELEEVLRRLTQLDCPVVGAGRTDSGVHARGQVVHFQPNWNHPLAELRQAMNALLPADIAVQGIFRVTASFHARHSALSRLYRYAVFNREHRSPFAARFAHQFSPPLDIEAMNQASKRLIGVHDFASFGQPPAVGHTVREVHVAQWWRQGQWVFFDIEANAFLRRMVRSLVGTLLLVGTGKMPPEEFGGVLAARDRSLAGPTSPPHGLCLERVRYPDPWREIGGHMKSFCSLFGNEVP